MIALFRDVDPALWRLVNHNPIALLKTIEPAVWAMATTHRWT